MHPQTEAVQSMEIFRRHFQAISCFALHWHCFLINLASSLSFDMQGSTAKTTWT